LGPAQNRKFDPAAKRSRPRLSGSGDSCCGHHFTKPIDLDAIDPVLAVDVSGAQRAKTGTRSRQGETL